MKDSVSNHYQDIAICIQRAPAIPANRRNLCSSRFLFGLPARPRRRSSLSYHNYDIHIMMSHNECDHAMTIEHSGKRIRP